MEVETPLFTAAAGERGAHSERGRLEAVLQLQQTAVVTAEESWLTEEKSE